jgi:hypothetical protein
MDNREWSNISSIKLLGSFVVKYKAFVTGLKVVLTAFEIGLSKIVVNDSLSSCLEDVEVGEQRYVEEHVTVENNGSWSHAKSTVYSGSRSVKRGLV